MTTKRQLREQICDLKHRIAYLEERLCPGKSHLWKLVDIRLNLTLHEIDPIYVYKCDRCGKEIGTYFFKKEVT